MVVTIGRKPPLASANPVTTPVPSATGTVLIAEATPDVPTESSTSPGSSAIPSAAPMLSPVPPATTDPRAVSAATVPGATMRGSAASWPSACSRRSWRHEPSRVAK